MSDDGGGDTGGGDTGGGDTGGGDTNAGNDYSGIGSTFSALDSALDFSSAVESTNSAIDDHSNDAHEVNNDYSGIGSTMTALGTAATLANNIKSTGSAFDGDNDSPSTRLRVDDDTYIPSGRNYLYGTPNTYDTSNNRTFWINRSGTGNSGNGNTTRVLVIVMSVVLIAILFFVIIINAKNDHTLASYKPIKIDPLPKGVYNALDMMSDKNKPLE